MMDELEVVLHVLFRSGGRVSLVVPKAVAEETVQGWVNHLRQKNPFGKEAETIHIHDLPDGSEMAFRVEDVSAVWFFEWDDPDEDEDRIDEEDDDED